MLSLLEMSGNILIPEEGQDSGCWIPSKDDVFMVAPFAGDLSSITTSSRQLDFLWKSKVLPRVLNLWLVLRGSILSMDNLRRRNMIIINACPLCLSGEESVDHVLMNCLMAHQVWTSISAGLSAVGLLLRALVIPLRVFFG